MRGENSLVPPRTWRGLQPPRASNELVAALDGGIAGHDAALPAHFCSGPRGSGDQDSALAAESGLTAIGRRCPCPRGGQAGPAAGEGFLREHPASMCSGGGTDRRTTSPDSTLSWRPWAGAVAGRDESEALAGRGGRPEWAVVGGAEACLPGLWGGGRCGGTRGSPSLCSISRARQGRERLTREPGLDTGLLPGQDAAGSWSASVCEPWQPTSGAPDVAAQAAGRIRRSTRGPEAVRAELRPAR